MRNMSFAMTTEAIKAGTKTVTRRYGWKFLRPGDQVRPVLKAIGLKKGEKVTPLRAPIRIVSVRREPLVAIIKEPNGSASEGFPHLSEYEFVEMLRKHYGTSGEDEVTRIQFEYTD